MFIIGFPHFISSEAFVRQITLIEPSVFITNGITTSLVKTPVHPAYDNPKLGSAAIRGFVDNALSIGDDPKKAAARFYELAHLSDPPLRLPIGKGAIVGGREQVKKIIADIDQYESWSEGLGFDTEA